jgi:hypothetical protein
MALTLATSVQGQLSGVTVQPRPPLEMPTNDLLVLSNRTGTVRLLNAQGVVLEARLAYQPPIRLADLSTPELQALLETETGYAAVTTFSSLRGTNGQGAAIENKLQQIWRHGTSLADKMQTRLEIIEDMRDYNNEVALLPGSEVAADQYALNAVSYNDRLTNRAGLVVTAAAHVEQSEQADAAGDARAGREVQQARATYRVAVDRVENANNRAEVANGQTVAANELVADYLARCATLSARLATNGIEVRATPPFYSIPPMVMRYEVDEERNRNDSVQPRMDADGR